VKRRTFIAALGSTAAWPMMAWAQQGAMPVIGWLNVPAAPGTMDCYLPAFKTGFGGHRLRRGPQRDY
jgi:putative tryptophan/tyrosine transport system substrate-binding protein